MTGPRRTLYRAPAMLMAGLIAVVGATWWMGLRIKSPEQAAAEADAPSPSAITAPVESRVLSTSLVVRGTIRLRQEQIISVEPSSTAGRPLVTRLPVKAGESVSEGTVVAEIAQRPVFVLQGTGPMFRDLSKGATGRDVAQLQAALSRLGYSTGDQIGKFGSGTAAAVGRFYKARGYEPVAKSIESDSTDQGERTSDEYPSAGSDGTPTVGVSEVIFLRLLPARVVAVSARMGQKADGELLRLASNGVVAEVNLTAAEAQRIEQGNRATVEIEELGKSFKGSVAVITKRKKAASKPQPEEEAEEGEVSRTESTPFVAQVAVGSRMGWEFRGEEVKVTFHLGGTEGKVLVVPVAAVWARADRTSYVKVQEQNGQSRQVKVRVGMSADGFTEVTAEQGDLHMGDLVVIGETAR